MAETLWLWLALASSIITAQNIEMNRRAGQEGYRLNLWRMVLSSAFWLPLATLQTWPAFSAAPQLYLSAIFAGAAIMVGFTIQTSLSQTQNGRVAAMHMPLKAVAVFFIWALLDTDTLMRYIDNPMRFLAILACLAAMTGALLTFRQNDVSWRSFKAVLPIVGLYAASDLLARGVLDPNNLQERLIIFLFLMSTSSAIMSFLLLRWRPQPALPLLHPPLLRAAGWAAIGGTLNQICFFAALALSANPAYPSMIGLLAPVWLLAYHRWAGVPDKASPLAGSILVGAAMVLMYIVA